MSVKFVGIKCDNPLCSWFDDAILRSDYHKWVNVPCGICGENLLTISDYNTNELLLSRINKFNSMSVDELNAIFHSIDPEVIQNSEVFKKLDDLDVGSRDIIVTFNVHDGISVSDIKIVDEGS